MARAPEFQPLLASSRFDLAALYVCPRGPYPVLAAECWDEVRDATKYKGTRRVIAHPPCGPWGRLRSFCKYDRADLAPFAVEQVRQYGGVLEHPAYSKLWTHCDLPRPGELFADAFGGRSYVIQQGDYGHVAPKLTWLYAVGLKPSPFRSPHTSPPGRVELQSSRVRHLTPPHLALMLCHWVVA